MQKKHVIIGTSAAGIAAARTLRNLDKESQIICYSDEAELPYNKCFLADYVHQHKTEQEVLTLTLEQAKSLAIVMHLGVRVMKIVPDKKMLMLSNEKIEHYDALLIATGTNPIMPMIEGVQYYSNVFAFHSLRDANRLNDFVVAMAPQRAVVVGAGLSGLEIADALCARNVQVTVVEAGPHVLARHAPSAGAVVIERMMVVHGLRVYTGVKVTGISGSEERASAIMLSEGTVLPADLIVFTVGLKQNNELAQEAGIRLSPEGIIVDDYLRTSTLDIYAAGDAIAVQDQLSGKTLASCTWPDAMQQGMHAAYAMAGKIKPYSGATIVTTSSFFGLKFFNCGAQAETEASYEVIERSGDDWYHRYVTYQGLLRGFCLVGNTQQSHKLRRTLLLKEPFLS